MKLLVAEKPSVARAFREMLERLEGERFSQRDGYFESRNYWISWCVGHLVGLADPAAYGWEEWRMEDLPMLPETWKLDVLRGTESQYRVLKDLMAKSVFIINGTDAGREGELIYRLVVDKAGFGTIPQFRLWLNSFVPADMEKAWKNLIPAQYMENLYRSALCRAQADWLVGMNLSRGYALGTGTRKLSVGRVQTPTLALIVKRDQEIEAWKDRFYFTLTAAWRGLRFLYVKDKATQFEAPAVLEQVKSACEGQRGQLTQFDKQARRLFPPRPFDLTELQKTANKVLGMKAAATLEAAQSLYEKKWITYPRTDSSYLPDGMQEEAWNIVQNLATAPERGVLRGKAEQFAFFDSSKVSDHFAIIPTGQVAGLDGLEDRERKVFELIRSRFVVAFGKPYEFEEYRALVVCNGHQFQARATLTTLQGFKSLNQAAAAPKVAGDAEDDVCNVLDKALIWCEGESDTLSRLQVDKHKASKPSHYSEASLLSAMETAGKAISDEALRDAMKERGLGTPATKAAIIERLKEQDYILAQGKHLVSTVKGRELIHLVDERVASPEMTGEWEWKLAQIARGKYSAPDFLGEIQTYVSGLKPSFTSEKAAMFSTRIKAEQAPCPKCKAAKLRENNYGLFCEDEQACGFKMWAKMGDKKLSSKNLADLLEKGRTGLIKGFKSKDGKKFDAALIMADWKVSYDFKGAGANQDSSAAGVGTILGPCPKCGTGKVVLGRSSYECTDFKGCGFKVYRSIAQRPILETEVRALLEKGRTGMLHGFKSREGKEFRAEVTLNKAKEVKLEFA